MKRTRVFHRSHAICLAIAASLCAACGASNTEGENPHASQEERARASSSEAATLQRPEPQNEHFVVSQEEVEPLSLTSSAEESKAKAAGQLSADRHFPPPDPGPSFEASAHEGDGVWGAFFDADFDPEKEGRQTRQLPQGFPEDALRRLSLHPHPRSRFQRLVVAAFDLSRFELHHRPGLQDVIDMGKDHLSKSAGLVEAEDQESLFAIFNGGFQPRHGRWGMLSLGEQIVPPRDDACTVAVLRDGSLRIATWPALAKLRQEIVAYRQTPPCLIENGEMHPRLKRKDRGPWAGQNDKRKTRRRSSVALSADGKLLFFGLGEETEADTLAAGLLHAGAASAAQLDINWNWTRLFLYAEFQGETRSVGALEKDMAKDKGEYLRRQAKRGFFYLTSSQRD